MQTRLVDLVCEHSHGRKPWAHLLVVVLRHWGGLQRLSWPEPGVLDRSGLTPSLLMVVGVVLVSFVKPIACSRYFVVLVPAVLPVLAFYLVL